MSEERDVAPPLTPEQGRRATIWRVLCRLVLRVQAKAEGRSPALYSLAEQEAIIGQHEAAMRHDLAMLSEICEEARRTGIADATNTLRSIETADPELVDEAIEVASNRADNEVE